MKKSMVTMSAALLFSVATVGFAQAQDGPVILGPVTGGEVYATPIADGAIEPIPAGPVGMAPLYDCVRVKDPHHRHPCAVPLIVQIADPCQPCDPCAPRRCISVQICVPPCGCPKITTRRHGHYVKYSYGKYRIEITSRRGVVTVDYDD